MSDLDEVASTGKAVILSPAQFRQLLGRISGVSRPVALMTMKAAREYSGLPRRMLQKLVGSGAVEVVPCLGPNGKPSRVHKRIVTASLDKWMQGNRMKYGR